MIGATKFNSFALVRFTEPLPWLPAEEPLHSRVIVAAYARVYNFREDAQSPMMVDLDVYAAVVGGDQYRTRAHLRVPHERIGSIAFLDESETGTWMDAIAALPELKKS